MTESDRWAKVERLFDEALDHPPSDLESWLAERCGDDEELADRLRRMLHAHQQPGVLDRKIPALAEADLRARLERALEGSYLIGETLGTGGMSSVFRAQEAKHDRAVVLKVLQPGLAAAIGPKRFDDEVKIAARLSHPHILALIDSGEVDGLRYYVMPFVGGVTLRAMLERPEMIPVGAGIAFLRDIAGALAHAHDAGVVHRDLKPENILCVEGHAFLLDFGVAKLEEGGTSTLTNPGLAVGTPGYMAPEQAAGMAVDHRADIYAWGLLAKEMLTGSRDPAAQVEDREGVPPTLSALVSATLAIDRNERPASANSLVAAMDGMLNPMRSGSRRWPMTAAGLVAVMAAIWWLGRGEPGVVAAELRQPIAVAPLRVETGEASLAGIGRFAGDWITQGLHESGDLAVVAWPTSRSAIERSDGGDDATALREATGAGTAVVGSIYALGDSLRLQVEIVDTRGGLVLTAPQPITVHRDSATAGIKLLRQRVMGALAVQLDDRLVDGADFAASPPTFAAYFDFDEGLSSFDEYQYDDAFMSMMNAWRKDTTFNAAIVMAAYAAWNGGNRPVADSLLREVALRRRSLGEHYVGVTAFLAGYLVGDYRAALDGANRAAVAARGSRADYNAAQAMMALDRPAEALARLDSLDSNRGPMRGWPAYWSERAYAAHLLGEHRREFAEADSMASRHPTLRVEGVIKARALGAIGATAILDSLLVAYDQLPSETYWSQGGMRVVAGEELTVHGDPEVGRGYFEDAVRWLDSRLNVAPDHAGHHYWRASALIALGRFAEAKRSVDFLRQRDDERLLYRGMAATLAARRGEHRYALSLLDSIPAWGRGEELVFRARIAAIEGDGDTALDLLTQALEAGVSGWHWQHGFASSDFESIAADNRFIQIMFPVR